ncbi:MAG: transposase [Anaerolineae bacterium]|nr:transposase [Anaerolineae bacterium]MDQ7037277.1 transposase [Anaerolineae bacterium]
MTQNNKHQRRSIRLPHYDYADEGAYFVTICTYERVCLFGTVDTTEDAMTLNTFERFVWDEWEKTGQLRDNVRLDRFVVMPNHVHGIIWITENTNQQEQKNEAKVDTKSPENVGAQRATPLHLPPLGATHNNVKPSSLGAIVRSFKSAVTKRINTYRSTLGGIVWQRNYWERIIRNDEELNWLRWYIDNNPARWKKDKLYVSKSDIMK